MSAAEAKKSDEKQTPPEKSTVILLFNIVADTTWRMFAPTFGGTALGLWAESTWHIAPWGGIVGLGIGILITAFLVRQLYKDAYKDNK
ncbi:MAG: hypothetical protein JWO07_725 [Candidatus Saccharibacteria bacterium]|nr:hypothetical protein [Candidatus Saccharibacteria bacterium]